MFITLNFILLFLVIILPGIVFRRMYFYGDFSKQFRIKEPLHHLFISNIIPGIIFLILSLLILRKLELVSPIIELYPKVRTSLEEEFQLDDDFFEDVLKITGTTFLFAFMIGYLSSRVIRLLRLDIKYKLLRYKNAWYYLFSGEISSFDRFKSNISIDEKIRKRRIFYPPLVDILIEKSSGKILYSGVLLDYEVSQDDLLRLERVYLKDTQRYSKRDGKTVPVTIPGDLFVLDTRKLINININYPVKSLFEVQEEEETKNARRIKVFNFINRVLGVLSLLLLVGFIFSLFIKLGWAFYDSHRWYGKLLLLLLTFQFIFIFTPKEMKDESERKKIVFLSWNAFFKSISWIVFWLIIYYVTH